MFRKFFLWILLIAAGAWSCQNRSQPEAKSASDRLTETLLTDTIAEPRKYGIESATITYDNAMKTRSVDIEFKSVVYFDDFGRRECKDSYSGGKLTESLMSDGRQVYKINHVSRTVYKLRKASRGTEPRFSWDEVPAEDKAAGRVKQSPDTTIAGKTCHAYHIEVNQVRASYAGWEHIMMYSALSSPGGKSIMHAVSVEAGRTDTSKFRIPKGYRIR